MTDLDQIQTIDDYFAAFGKHHVQKATQLLQPLHVPDQDSVPDFSDMNRQPYEPQAHVIAASIKMLDESRRGITVGEMGIGKTLMGMLTIHHHAQRSARQGGCNGRYRAIVLCPDHLIKKWQDDLEETIPGVKVTVFDAAGKGCKYLISDMNQLYEQVRGRNGRWRKPEGAEWYIPGRDQAKYLPARSALGNKRIGFGRRVLENGSSQRLFVELDGDDGETKRIVARRWICLSCGKPVVDKNGAAIKVPDLSKLLNCDGKFAREIAEPDRK
jgi:hypothetical protein